MATCTTGVASFAFFGFIAISETSKAEVIFTNERCLVVTGLFCEGGALDYAVWVVTAKQTRWLRFRSCYTEGMFDLAWTAVLSAFARLMNLSSEAFSFIRNGEAMGLQATLASRLKKFVN